MPADPVPEDADHDPALDALLHSYDAHDSMHHLGSAFLPSRAKTIELVELLRRIVFPGFFDDRRLTRASIRSHAGELLGRARGLLYEQARQALRYDKTRREGGGAGERCEECDAAARAASDEFFGRLPELRAMLATDVQATFDGDPAAVSSDEVVFCYPGLDAVFIHRIAHALCKLNVPLLPRIMSEYAHNETGVDIHPGATIAQSFCIDHGTGVVIGETCEIGRHVKVYQGVTLGALSTKGGQDWRGRKRHPTIGDHVTIYGGAIILGGETVIGEGATIGGSVFIIASIPPHSSVTLQRGDLKITQRRPRKERGQGAGGRA